MTTIAFTSGAATWQPSRNPDEPTEQLRFSQATARTAAGITYGYDPVTQWEIIPLSWSYLPDADVSALITFVESTIGWLQPFTVTEPDGSSYTAELDTPALAIEERYSGGKQVSLALRSQL